jgi:hypothetical protein
MWQYFCIVGKRVFGSFVLAACLALCACASKVASPGGNVQGAAHAAPPPAPGPTPVEPGPQGPFAEWLRGRLPVGGRVVAVSAGALAVVHTVVPDDTPQTIAKAYLDLTDVYRAKDLAAEIERLYPSLHAGAEVEIPHLLSAPYRTPDEQRLGWPADRALKGVYIGGPVAGLRWPETIEKLAARKLNAVVLDGKDYMGPMTYPSKVKLAVETGAAKDPPIPDLFRAIRFAHARGVRVIVRISCFHDPWAAKHAPRLSIMRSSGSPFPMGWIDPANQEAQDYLVDLVKESVDLGADEVQLDYVRFPVHATGVHMPAPNGRRSQTMKAFVRRAHEATAARQVPLSIDVFGVTATGEPSDIEALGQNLGVIGSEAEAVSPMVYPSHYSKGYNGFDEPGDHPEIVGIGTKGAIAKLRAGKVAGTIIRPWLQASAYKTTTYGPQYILREIKSAETNGAVGWLMWDAGNSYWAVWQALPVIAGGPGDTTPAR